MVLDVARPVVDGWQNFYLIIGPSAAALMGLQFVVMALVKDSPAAKSPLGVDAFTTPTIVHFAAVLSVAAVLSAPWPSLHAAVVTLCTGAVLCLLYVLVVLRRIMRVHQYEPVAEDWLWHVVLPLIAYATIAIAGCLLVASTTTSLFVIAAATMLLLFVGVHNAWDIATYLSLQLATTTAASSDAASDNMSSATAPGSMPAE